ncbi:MAG: hypothetical protein J7K59_07265 [Candidatus Korarchaeota archaeon]|nr:hypothetical protein [Candidatus Korarchaeota archaeon]
MTTLKIDDKINEIIERFLAELLLKDGVKIDKKTLVEKAILWTIKNADFIEKELLNEKIEIEKDPAWILLEKPMSWGIKDASIKIDEFLYGG